MNLESCELWWAMRLFDVRSKSPRRPMSEPSPQAARAGGINIINRSENMWTVIGLRVRIIDSRDVFHLWGRIPFGQLNWFDGPNKMDCAGRHWLDCNWIWRSSNWDPPAVREISCCQTRDLFIAPRTNQFTVISMEKRIMNQKDGRDELKGKEKCWLQLVGTVRLHALSTLDGNEPRPWKTLIFFVHGQLRSIWPVSIMVELGRLQRDLTRHHSRKNSSAVFGPVKSQNQWKHGRSSWGTRKWIVGPL